MKRQVLYTLLLALVALATAGQAAPAHAQVDVLDFSTIGKPNDDTFDNTAALVQAIEARSPSTDERMVIYVPAGDWYFEDTLPVNSHADPTIFDNVTIVGAPSAQSAQHQEAGSSNVEKSRTRFIIDMDNETDTWWDQVRTYRFGPLAFRDITFQVEDVGRLFSFGDTADLAAAGAEARGILFERCYFTHLRHFASTDVGGGHAWIYNAETLPAENWVINTTNQSFSIRLHKCYDVTIRDCTFRGARYGVINTHGDRVVMTNLHGMSVGKLIDEYSLGGQAAVGSQLDDIFVETPLLTGAVITGAMGKARIEAGYSLPTPIGPYALPSDVDWEIDTGSSTVDFTFPVGWGYDCTDYFEPHTVIRVSPTESIARRSTSLRPCCCKAAKVRCSTLW